MAEFPIRFDFGAEGPLFFQGWHPGGSETLAAGFAGAGGVGVIRLPAFPDWDELSARLSQMGDGWVGLDLRGVLGDLPERFEARKRACSAFIMHAQDMMPERLERLRAWGLPRVVEVADDADAVAARSAGAAALLVAEGEGVADRLMRMLRSTSLPCFAPVSGDAQEGQSLLARGAAGLQLRSPALLREDAAAFLDRFRKRLADALGRPTYEATVEQAKPALPSLRIRHLEVPYPIIQGGMGIGVSWDRLAGSVAKAGCVGIVSAIGTGYRFPDLPRLRAGRPDQPENLNHSGSLARILANAKAIAQGRGPVGVNILCAINDYERVVRDSVAGGADLIISGAGLPLSLPEYVGDAEVALVPIVSSARALKLICKHWQRKYNRLPDAVILEGPESGGHQGFSYEQCLDPAFSLEAILPSVCAERDQWGDFPVIAAGGVWDRADVERLLALGAGGVQMATRFIGTFECDAATGFKEVILKADQETIALHKSPVGMPARGVLTPLHGAIAEGTAPRIKCISDCVAPCEHGRGAVQAGFCIADRLGDAWNGARETGLFFTGSNGWRLRDLIHVDDLVAEITEDWGLAKLAGRGAH